MKRLIVKQYFKDRINKMISSTETDISFTEDDLKHYPRYLYKYRDCKQDYNFQMIEEEYLWADIPASFYDPYDALVNLKLKSELPYIQKMLTKKAREHSKICIVATEMLESMIHNPRPTRAEISDVANAVYDGTSAVMLSGETAAGKYPVDAVRNMAEIAEYTEKNFNKFMLRLKDRKGFVPDESTFIADILPEEYVVARYEDLNLKKHTAYYYRVCAVNKQGICGKMSDEFCGITREE